MIVRSCAQRRTPAWPQLSSAHLVATKRHFHASSAVLAEMLNHYDTLQVPTSASPQDIKKSFYKLSKANHPDLHPNDSTASQRFVKISEAYAVLGSAEKKQRYDRDFFPQQYAAGRGGPAYSGPSGSHSSHQASTGPGGRPASGLSRRRTQFRGPPPSFYRNGGWGEHGAKRQEASEKASHTYEARGEAASGPQGPGMGPGGFAQGFDGDVRWFDQDGHMRTGESVEERMARRRRARKQGASFDDVGGGSTMFNFLLVGGILGAIAGISGVLMGGGSATMKGHKKASEA